MEKEAKQRLAEIFRNIYKATKNNEKLFFLVMVGKEDTTSMTTFGGGFNNNEILGLLHKAMFHTRSRDEERNPSEKSSEEH